MKREKLNGQLFFQQTNTAQFEFLETTAAKGRNRRENGQSSE
jgi:hypothetical protein